MSWKIPSSLVNEAYGSDASRHCSRSDLPASIRDVHEHIAGVERGLFEEIERRIASEERIREQVESKIKVAVERLADVTETEMSRMFRRLEADLSERLDAVSREVSGLNASIKKLNNQIELVTVETRENRNNVVRLQKQMESTIPDQFGVSGSTGSILETGKKEFSKLKELIEKDLNTSKRLDQVNDDLNKRIFPRVETVEDWLKNSLTPEVLRLRERLELERITREDNEKNMMDIVQQYTGVIQNHFDYLSTNFDRFKEEETLRAKVSKSSTKSTTISKDLPPAPSFKKFEMGSSPPTVRSAVSMMSETDKEIPDEFEAEKAEIIESERRPVVTESSATSGSAGRSALKEAFSS
jgi:hypothetical protein